MLDEDLSALSQQPASPASLTQPIHQDDVPAGTLLFALPEEHYDVLRALPPPVPALFAPLYQPDTNDDPTLAKFVAPDEDNWQLGAPPLPVPQSYAPVLLPDTNDDPAGAFKKFTVPDEDLDEISQLPAPVSASLAPLYLPDGDDQPAGSFIELSTPDEDNWQLGLPPLPVTQTFAPLLLPDPEEIPATHLTGLVLDSPPFFASQVASAATALSVGVGTSGTNRTLVAVVTAATSGGATPFPVTVSGGGLTWTKAVEQVATGAFLNSYGASIWVAQAPTRLSFPTTITATFSNVGAISAQLAVYSYGGASAVLGATGTTWSGTSAPESVNVGGVGAGSSVLFGVGTGGAAGVPAPLPSSLFDDSTSDPAGSSQSIGRLSTGLQLVDGGAETVGASQTQPTVFGAALELRPTLGYTVVDADLDFEWRQLLGLQIPTRENAPLHLPDPDQTPTALFAGLDDMLAAVLTQQRIETLTQLFLPVEDFLHTFEPDEDAQPPIAVQATPWSLTLFSLFDEGEPLERFVSPDEDIDPRHILTPQVPTAYYVVQPYNPESDQQGVQLYGVAEAEQDFDPLAALPAPVALTLLPILLLPDPNELLEVMDEYLWQNPTPPAPASFYQQFPQTEADDVPAGRLAGQVDEDLGAPMLPPWPRALDLSPLYLPDPEEYPVTEFHGLPDADLNQLAMLPAPVAASLAALVLTDPEQVPAGVLKGLMEEDLWQLGPAPTSASLAPLYLPNVDDIPRQQAAALQPDEDFFLPTGMGAIDFTAPSTLLFVWAAETMELLMNVPALRIGASPTTAAVTPDLTRYS